MTRDEAIEKLRAWKKSNPENFIDDKAAKEIDKYAELGILKLDGAPQDERLYGSVKSKIRRMSHNYASSGSIFDWIDRLDAWDMKIVEK